MGGDAVGSGRDSVTSAAEGGNLGTTGPHYGIFQGYKPTINED